MFQFTTTNVINSLQDLTTGLPLWSVCTRTNEAGEEEVTLNVKRVNNFNKDNVVAIYKSEAVTPKFAELHMDMSTITVGEGKDVKKGDILRLSIYIRLAQSSQSSYYSNDMVFKGKPFSIEFKFDSDWESTLKKLEKNIKKYAIMVYEKELLKVSADGTDLIIKATDEYQRFYEVAIEKYNADKYHGMGDFEVLKSKEDLTEVFVGENDKVEVGSDEFFAGREGFGTYSYLLHNLRLPTTMRTRIYAINSDETPVPGAKYNEYVIHYCKNRGILGSNAVGDLVKSMTTHVFYVNQDLLDKTPEEGDLNKNASEGAVWEVKDFEGALKLIAGDSEEKFFEVKPKSPKTEDEP